MPPIIVRVAAKHLAPKPPSLQQPVHVHSVSHGELSTGGQAVRSADADCVAACGRLRGSWRASVFACLILSLSLVATTATADPRTARLSESLRADDYRVRTNAALALGGTADDDAVAPLCGVLTDTSEVVRQASAAALKRLAKPAALGCLRTQLAREQSDTVKTQLTRAIEALESTAAPAASPPGASAAGAPNPGAKYYVALSAVTNRTTRPQPEIEALVLRALRSKMDTIGTFEIAPARETEAVAKATISRRKLKGLYLSISVDPIKYDGGTSATVKVAVFSYPNKDLRAEVPARGTVSGGARGDAAAENAAMEFAAARAIELIAKNADNF